MSYADYMTRPPTPGADPPDGLAPPWLSNPAGKAWLATLGAAKDALVADTKLAVKCRFPSVAPEDALPFLGEERSMPRGPGESTDAYRARLAGAFEAWRWSGTAYGLLAQFRLAGFGRVIVQTQTGKQQELLGNTATPADLVTTDLGTVHLGGTPAELWSDFSVLIARPYAAWWTSVPGDDSADAAFVRQLIARWKPAHTRCVKLAVIDGPVWDGGWEWDDATTWDSGTVTDWTP